jgi:hypothetical protein
LRNASTIFPSLTSHDGWAGVNDDVGSWSNCNDCKHDIRVAIRAAISNDWSFALQQSGGIMPRFYQPDLSIDLDSPFVRDASDKLVRRSYWLDMDDRTVVLVMTKGIGASLTNDEKRAHLTDIRRAHLIDQVCPQEILPPEK